MPQPSVQSARQISRVEPGSEVLDPEEKALFLSSHLDVMLDELFGPSFAQVIEHEVKSRLGTGLYASLRADQAAAMAVLLDVLKTDLAVRIVLKALRDRVKRSPLEWEKEALLLSIPEG